MVTKVGICTRGSLLTSQAHAVYVHRPAGAQGRVGIRTRRSNRRSVRGPIASVGANVGTIVSNAGHFRNTFHKLATENKRKT